MSGAAVLCASAALRGGAGLVRVAIPADILPIVAAGNPCYTTLPLPQDADGHASAEAEAVFDGQTYRLGAGDAAFAGVGCVHGFRNVGTGPVRWLETQAPPPPGRHSYRFVRDWDYLRTATEGHHHG